MNAITNILRCYLNYKKINENYDIFLISTSKKYFESGSYLLDKPTNKLKALSLIFEPKSKSAFVLYKKGTTTNYELQEALESDDIAVSKMKSEDLKDYLLLRLFLSSLGNYRSILQFNNLSGHLYLTDERWINKKHTVLKAMEMTISNEMGIEAHAVTFTSTKILTKKECEGLPRYSLDGAGSAMRRVTAPQEGEETFVRKSKFGYKSNIDFLTLSNKRGEHSLTRSYMIYKIVSMLNGRYGDFLSLSFEEREIARTIATPSQKKFMDGAVMDLRMNEIYIVNLCRSSEYDELFESLHRLLEDALGGKFIDMAEEPQSNGLNIVFLHNQEFYKEEKLDDPYKSLKRDFPIQCVTVEECQKAIEDGDKPVIDTILKELLIKENILVSHSITLDDWYRHGFRNPYYFGCLSEDTLYFMTVEPNGHISFTKKKNDFSDFRDDALNELSDELLSSSLKGKYILKDSDGNINIVGRTDQFTLPRKEIFETAISRGKEDREKYLSGVVDINLYGNGDYNVGIIGSGMQATLPKASRIYKVEIVRGKNIMEDLLPLTSVLFVKLNEFTVIPYPFKYLREFIQQ